MVSHAEAVSETLDTYTPISSICKGVILTNYDNATKYRSREASHRIYY